MGISAKNANKLMVNTVRLAISLMAKMGLKGESKAPFDAQREISPGCYNSGTIASVLLIGDIFYSCI